MAKRAANTHNPRRHRPRDLGQHARGISPCLHLIMRHVSALLSAIIIVIIDPYTRVVSGTWKFYAFLKRIFSFFQARWSDSDSRRLSMSMQVSARASLERDQQTFSRSSTIKSASTESLGMAVLSANASEENMEFKGEASNSILRSAYVRKVLLCVSRHFCVFLACKCDALRSIF